MKKDKRVLVYTSDKNYILAYESDMKNNGISSGVYINDGYGRNKKASLKTTLYRLSKMTLKGVKSGKITFDGLNIMEIPFYKDIKQSETDEFGNQYKYTFIKNINLVVNK